MKFSWKYLKSSWCGCSCPSQSWQNSLRSWLALSRQNKLKPERIPSLSLITRVALLSARRRIAGFALVCFGRGLNFHVVISSRLFSQEEDLSSNICPKDGWEKTCRMWRKELKRKEGGKDCQSVAYLADIFIFDLPKNNLPRKTHLYARKLCSPPFIKSLWWKTVCILKMYIE